MDKHPYHVVRLSSPDLGLVRAPGPGLGNLLFPIGRAVMAQAKVGGTLVLPTMRQIKIGPYLRREPDKRTYGDVFKRRSAQEMRLWLRSKWLQFADTEKIVLYHGLGLQFHDLEGGSGLMADFLRSRAASLPPKIDYDIAIHVRLGDFAQATMDATEQNTQLPLEWYRSALEEAVRLLGVPSPRIMVFSDENPEKVARDIGLKNAQPETKSTALGSMLSMSQARIIVASRSTFSLWGQYLGQSRAIWPEGFNLEKYKPVRPDRDFFV